MRMPSKLTLLVLTVIGIGSAISIALVVGLSASVKLEAYTWSTLYLGGAIVSAISSLVTIPFAIWVLVMQSRYGPIVLRMFFFRIVNLFLLMLASIFITAVAMILSFTTRYYVAAYIAIIVESAAIIPVIGAYVLKLMTLRPSEIIDTVVKGSTRFDETIAALFKLASVYIEEPMGEENAVLLVLYRALSMLRKTRLLEKNPPSPAAWHEFRAFIDSLIKKEVPLPSRRLMGAIMREFLRWLLMHGKDRAASMLMRHYRRLALKYLEVRLPSEVVRDLLVRAIIEPVESVEVKPSVRAFAYEQLHAFLSRVRAMALRGEITRRELCSCIAVLGKQLASYEECEALEWVREYITKLSREFRCRTTIIEKPARPVPEETKPSTSTEAPQQQIAPAPQQQQQQQTQAVGSDEVRPA